MGAPAPLEFAAAREDATILAFIDGDGSDDPASAPAIIGPVIEGQADFCLASRLSYEREAGSMAPSQVLAGRLAGFLMRARYGVRYTDMAPFRAILRDRLEALGMTETTYGWNLEMQMQAAACGLRIREVPVRCRRCAGVVSSLLPEGAGPTDSTLYLVASGSKGVSIAGPWDGLGMRANASAPMAFEDCEVAPAGQLAQDGASFPEMINVVLPLFNLGRLASTTLVDNLERPRDKTVLRVLEAKAAAGDAAVSVTSTAMRASAYSLWPGSRERSESGRTSTSRSRSPDLADATLVSPLRTWQFAHEGGVEARARPGRSMKPCRRCDPREPAVRQKQSYRVVRPDGEGDTEREDYDGSDLFITTSNGSTSFSSESNIPLIPNILGVPPALPGWQ